MHFGFWDLRAGDVPPNIRDKLFLYRKLLQLALLYPLASLDACLSSENQRIGGTMSGCRQFCEQEELGLQLDAGSSSHELISAGSNVPLSVGTAEAPSFSDPCSTIHNPLFKPAETFPPQLAASGLLFMRHVPTMNSIFPTISSYDDMNVAAEVGGDGTA